MNIQVTFDDSTRDFILNAFGKVASGDFVYEKTKTDQKVLTPRGEEIPLKEFAGVRKGSVIFLKSDVVSLVEAARAISS